MAERSYAAGRFAFDVAGSFAGYIKKVSGGVTKGEVVTHNLGTTNIQKKHLATITHEPVTIEIGMGMGKSLWEWIKASWDKDFQVKTCSLTAADFNYKAMATRVFQDAYIKKVTIPALDGSAKDSGYFTVEIDPEIIRYEAAGGQTLQGDENPNTKKWLTSNFKFEVSGLEDACKRISKVDSLAWEQKVVKDEVGQFREPTKHAAAVTVPNIKLTISQADIGPWAEWHKTFVIDGKCDDGAEKKATLTMLGPDLVEELCVIDFDHVGIISLEQESFEANSENVSRFTVELYAEEMTISSYAE
ncbi:phage tail protein [Haliangium sp.]|uniref:phage tail protein n=1 Tax=Haliangium sp. TaxID=2663208 RepID=UPI003D118EA7